jgi:hypothetical protein
MAQSYVTDAGVLIIPGAYPTVKVQNGASGLSTTGVIFLVGEADAGPDFTLESDLTLNAFGPDQAADVSAKYVSGPLVDAFKAAATPANDPDIVGAPNRFILVKTNPSTKASAALPKIGGVGSYATLFNKSYGQLGNLVYLTVAQKQAEVKPTTGLFTYIPPVGTVNVGLRVSGGAEVARTGVAAESPAVFQAAIDALTGIDATGGINRAVLSSTHGSLTVAAPGGNVATFTLSAIAAWDATPSVGDTLVIPAGSAVAGAGNANVGAYVITAASATVITATKLSDAAKPGAVAGVITAPVAVSVQSVVGANIDLVAYAPIAITPSASVVVDGIGKSLEINQLTGGTDLLSRTAYVLGTTTPVSWISATGSPKLITSAAEYAVTLNVNRQFDNVQEQLSAGGKIALKLGYAGGTSCGVVVGPSTIVLTPVGGLSGGQTITVNLKSYPTLADLASYIGSLPGFSCAVGTTTLGQYSPLGLDEGSWTCASTFGNQTLRVKVDATTFFNLVQGNSALVQVGNPAATAAAGLPDVTASTVYLAGGARGATTDAIYDAAIDALEGVKGNFLVPLFSRDAAADIADGITDSASSYTIANVQAYAKTHCLKMSTLKKRRNRQAFLAQRDSFLNCENAAATLANARCALAFQDVKVVGGNGIIQAQPHVLAALAAGMQAAGFYRAIVHKGINCNGVLQAAGDWKDTNDTNVEDALSAGLLPAQKSDDGGFRWVSDQTTYSKDSNFVYNSIQAVYTTDIIALTCAQRMEKAFVGQSVADVSAALALAALESIMADFLRLKLIAVSDDAPKGFKNASIRISGTTMLVNVEIKLAGAIYFIPINFLVSQVTQAAA